MERRPLAAQLRDMIWDKVERDHLRTGDKLPAEKALIEQYGVSRATVREALKLLEEQRLIICKHGVGRFVAPGPSGVLSEGITRLDSVSNMADQLNISLTTRVLSMYEELPGDVVRARLDLDPGSSVVVLERVRRADGDPVIYSIDVFPRSIVVGDLPMQEFAGSLLAVMEGRWGVRLAYSRAVISAVVLDDDISEAIEVTPCVPWILLEQTNYDPQDRPVLYSKDYHRGDRFQFHVLRTRR